MPLYDYLCKQGHTTESFENHSVKRIVCPQCGGRAKRVFSFSGVNTANEDAPWLKSVLEIVDTSATAKPETREFRRNPTRSNWKAWMKAEQIRPMERGEEHDRPICREVSTDKLCELHMKRNALEVRTR